MSADVYEQLARNLDLLGGGILCLQLPPVLLSDSKGRKPVWH